MPILEFVCLRHAGTNHEIETSDQFIPELWRVAERFGIVAERLIDPCANAVTDCFSNQNSGSAPNAVATR
jgi:hypothetical protein